MNIQSPEIKDSLHKRLRRIEGQARGIQQMLDDDRDCREILQQLNAVHAAIERATAEFVRTYAKDCLLTLDGTSEQSRTAMVDALLDLMSRVK